ncbi:MAG: glutathione synthase [Oscillospiraceae bacterium]
MHNSHMLDGRFGLERETLRVDKNGRLAQTPHPFEDEHLTRDFCENQLEIVTPVCRSIDEAVTELERLDAKAREVLSRQNETLWLYSNPPHIESEDEIPVALFEGKLSAKSSYRKNLEHRYGKRLMLYSGLHFNFSFSEEYLHELHDKSGLAESYEDFKNDFYLRLLKQASRYSWLLVFLTAASPVYDKSFDEDNSTGIGFDGYSSMRSGERGYWNQFVPQLDFSSLESYIAGIQRYIDKGVLFSAGELYLPVRLKPKGENSLEALRQNGADHIELRMFDLDPLEPLGINITDLRFAHLLLVYLSAQEDLDFTVKLQEQAIKNHKAAAAFNAENIKIDGVAIYRAAELILCDMADFFADFEAAKKVIEYENDKIHSERLCEKVKNRITIDYQRDILKLSEKAGGDNNVRAFGVYIKQESGRERISEGVLQPQR